MAKYYGTTPSSLLDRPLGEWSFDWECYQADAREQERERARVERERGRPQRSRTPPDWPTE